MTKWDDELLSEPSRRFVEDHLDAPVLVADLSWGLTDTKVLRIRSSGRDFVVKAAGPDNHHLGREISAHESATHDLVERGYSSCLHASDRSTNTLITDFLPGRLVEGSSFELSYDIHAQAGAALRVLHDTDARADSDYEPKVIQKALKSMEQPHQISPQVEAKIRYRLTRYEPQTVTLVPTHGDWHPRNWLVDEGQLRVIDFGRFDYRPAATDLCRLTFQQWSAVPELERAFIDGYGPDPREQKAWPIYLLLEAVGTAVWAYQVRDAEFENRGHHMLDESLRRLSESDH